MIAVIADDITGAAEMAGIGFRYGLRTSLVTEVSGALPYCDILVVATDTRSMAEEEAVAETRRVVRRLWDAGVRKFFKKTDSALRGHVVPELIVLLEELPYTRVVYLPQNPSKGRVIKEGVYYINGKPLHETSFAFDPEFPATTSVVTERLPGIQRLEGTILFPDFKPKKGELPIYVADAFSESEISLHLSEWIHPDVLFAGAADLFTSYIKLGSLRQDSDDFSLSAPFKGLQSERALIVCGSTQSKSLSEETYIKKHAIPVVQMPEDVFEGIAPALQWSEQLKTVYQYSHSMVLTIGYPSKGGKDFALRLRTTLSEVVAALVAESCPAEVVIEGGATAFAILKALGWKSFRLTDEVAPGVVRMRREEVSDVCVTLKPGSYPWGDLFC